MRKWCAVLGVGALIALPLCAQQKDARTSTTGSEISENAVPARSLSGDFNIAPGSPRLFPMPAAAAQNRIFLAIGITTRGIVMHGDF